MVEGVDRCSEGGLGSEAAVWVVNVWVVKELGGEGVEEWGEVEQRIGAKR